MFISCFPLLPSASSTGQCLLAEKGPSPVPRHRRCREAVAAPSEELGFPEVETPGPNRASTARARKALPPPSICAGLSAAHSALSRWSRQELHFQYTRGLTKPPTLIVSALQGCGQYSTICTVSKLGGWSSTSHSGRLTSPLRRATMLPLVREGKGI